MSRVLRHVRTFFVKVAIALAVTSCVLWSTFVGVAYSSAIATALIISFMFVCLYLGAYRRLMSLGVLRIFSACAVILTISCFFLLRHQGSVLDALTGFAFEPGTVISMFLCLLAVISGYVIPKSVSDYSKVIRLFVLVIGFMSFAVLCACLVPGSIFLTQDALWTGYPIMALFGFFCAVMLFQLDHSRLGTMIALLGFGGTSMLIEYMGILPLTVVMTIGIVIMAMHMWFDSSKNSSPHRTYFVSVLATLFFVATLSDLVGIQWHRNLDAPADVRPSLSLTADIFLRSAGTNPGGIVFGSGPDGFMRAWNGNRSMAVNNSKLWNTDFEYGNGLVMTLLLDNGLLLACLLIGGIFYICSRFIALRSLGVEGKVLFWAGLLQLLSLAVVTFLYIPPLAFLLVSAINMGMLLRQSEAVEQEELKTLTGRIVTHCVLLVLLIGALGVGYISIPRLRAITEYQHGMAVLRAGMGYSAVSTALQKSWDIVHLPRVGREWAQGYYDYRTALLNKGASALDQKDELERVTGIAQGVVALEPKSMRNLLLLGLLYAGRVPKTIEDDRLALSMFLSAVKNAPDHPYPKFLASVFLLQVDPAGNKVQAEKLLTQALKLRPQYTEVRQILDSIALPQ